MNKPHFKIVDHIATDMGTIYLRERELLGRRGVIVTEVMIDHELLMSSLNTRSEEALAEEAFAWRGGEDAGLRVLVGGLGLGYTAHATLANERVAALRVVEALPRVIEWTREGLIPLSKELNADERLELSAGDVYAELLGPAAQTWDLILIDVDHTPTERLGPSSAPFYTPEGLERVKAHLAPGGVLAVWSAGDDDAFAATLSDCFAKAERAEVVWVNELINDGEEVVDVIFLARD